MYDLLNICSTNVCFVWQRIKIFLKVSSIFYTSFLAFPYFTACKKLSTNQNPRDDKLTLRPVNLSYMSISLNPNSIVL